MDFRAGKPNRHSGGCMKIGGQLRGPKKIPRLPKVMKS